MIWRIHHHQMWRIFHPKQSIRKGIRCIGFVRAYDYMIIRHCMRDWKVRSRSDAYFCLIHGLPAVPMLVSINGGKNQYMCNVHSIYSDFRLLTGLLNVSDVKTAYVLNGVFAHLNTNYSYYFYAERERRSNFTVLNVKTNEI